MIFPYAKNDSTAPTRRIGKVILAAAGPGDPDLITVKAVEAIRRADVVLADRLVSEVILHRYVPAQPEIVYVGKECRKKVSTPQAEINDLLVRYAQEGKTVVRLKGGDVSVFSNILDELEALVSHQIPYEIIPGVTAALGAAAYSGMPLTARGYATAVRFLTYYKSDVVTDDYWRDLAATKDTLVFYMSSTMLDGVVAKLLENKISEEVHVAVIEQATTCFQRVYTCGIHEYEQKLKGKDFISPSLVIIGRVVTLQQQFQWLHNSPAREQYFESVARKKQSIIELKKIG
ncbi:MAG: uroporphyrinogen-III C-methyltransferase [Niabella sp.]